MRVLNRSALCAIFISVLSLTGCGGSDSDSGVASVEYAAVVQTVADDYTGSNLQVIDLNTFDVSDGILPHVVSDYIIATNGQYFYQIGRHNIDTISAYDITDANAESSLYDYSLLDDPNDDSVNAYEMAFASESKAYIVPYGNNTVWIVNPQAQTEIDFKLGELDLSAYADTDGIAEASAAIVVNGELYITMQRLNRDNGFTPNDNTTYVAVFDTATDTEIDTNLADSVDNLKGIELDIRNLGKITYQEEVGLVVQGIGNAWGNENKYTGGIVLIDTVDYSVTTLVDDGAGEYGNIADVAIVNATNGYFVGQQGASNKSLFQFNPQTRVVTPVANEEFNGVNISVLAVSPDNELWVGIGDLTEPAIYILDPNEINVSVNLAQDANFTPEYSLQELRLLQSPRNIRFAEVPNN